MKLKEEIGRGRGSAGGGHDRAIQKEHKNILTTGRKCHHETSYSVQLAYTHITT